MNKKRPKQSSGNLVQKPRKIAAKTTKMPPALPTTPPAATPKTPSAINQKKAPVASEKAPPSTSPNVRAAVNLMTPSGALPTTSLPATPKTPSAISQKKAPVASEKASPVTSSNAQAVKPKTNRTALATIQTPNSSANLQTPADIIKAPKPTRRTRLQNGVTKPKMK